MEFYYRATIIRRNSDKSVISQESVFGKFEAENPEMRYEIAKMLVEEHLRMYDSVEGDISVTEGNL